MVILVINGLIDKTMKNRLNFKKMTLVGVLFFGLSLAACSDDDNAILIETSGITMMSDMNTAITEGAMGDFIAIHGTGLDYENIDSILVNDVRVEMLETYSEKDVLYMQIPVKLPRKETDKIYIFNSKGVKELNFKTLAPKLKLTRMFNEYTKPGDTIMIYGDYFDLYEIDSLNAVVDFNGKESKVIASLNTALIARVPLDVDKNIKVKVRGIKWDVEATCPGRYYDRGESFVMDFDEIMPDYAVNVVTDVEDPYRFSGNYLRVDDNVQLIEWDYFVKKSGVTYTDDMLAHPDNYVVKCEFRTANQFVTGKIGFDCWIYWAATPMKWQVSDFVFQKTNTWETISLPFNCVRSADYPDAANHSTFDVRMDVEPEIVKNFAFDNFRICKKGD